MKGRNRDTDVENKCVDTKGESSGGGRVMNWEIGIDMYTLMCIKLITNKNLLYKKINKIKLKKKEFLHEVSSSKIVVNLPETTQVIV